MKLVIPGPPIPKARARLKRVKSFVTSYDPQQKEKENVKWQMNLWLTDILNSNNKDKIIELNKLSDAECVVMNFKFFMPIPESESLFDRNLKLWQVTKHNKKPDCSNLIKFYEDCANGILFSDDSKIVKGSFLKIYSDNPRTELEIMPKTQVLDSDAKNILKSISPNEIKEFLSDIHQFDILNNLDHENMDDDQQTEYSNLVALTLIKFSQKHAGKLNKIAKKQKINIDEKLERYVPMQGRPLC